MDRHRGEGADADGAGGQAVEGGHRLPQPFLGGQNVSDGGQNALPFGGEADARPASRQQPKPEFLLQ